MNRLALALLFFAAAAFAEPATIKVFEAKVYEKPDATSAVLHAFPENAQVSISEAPENGFRKVRLPDGKIGYVEESSLSLGAAKPSDAPLRTPEAVGKTKIGSSSGRKVRGAGASGWWCAD